MPAKLEAIPVTKEDLEDCDEVLELKGTKAKEIVPWAVDTLKKYNECAESKASLAAKVRAHNKKSQ